MYANVVHGGFIWDDNVFVIHNPLIREPGRFAEIWLTREAADYWPLSYSFFWLAWRLFGENPAGYHVCNIVLHALAAGLVWRCLQRLGCRWGFVTALAFVVHPVNVEAVAWMFQVKTTLAAALAFASLLAWLRYLERPTVGVYALSVGLFLASLLAKSTTVTWPFVILGAVWWRRGRATARDLRLASPFFLASLVLGLNGVLWYETDLLPAEQVRGDGLLSRIAGAGWTFWFYLLKAVWPADLTFVYPRWPIPFTQPLQFVPTAALLALVAACWTQRHSAYGRAALAAVGYDVVALVPVLGFFDIYFMRFSLVADHFQYLALAGVLAALVEVAGRTLERRQPRAAWALAVPIVLMAGLTMRQNRVYASEEAVWRDTVEKNPTAWLAWLSLGVTLEARGETEAALAHFERALAARPGDFEALAQIARIRERQGRRDEAVALLRRALAANPRAASAVDQLTAILADSGQVPEAVQLCTGLLAVKPRLPAIRNNCAVYLQAAGRVEEAIALWRPLAVLDREQPLTEHHRAAIHNLAAALRDVGQMDEALRYYGRAAEIGYRAADSHLNAGVILFNKGDVPQAIDHLNRAVRLDPANAEALFVRGLAHGRAGDVARQCTDVRHAASMGFAAAREVLASCPP